MRTLLNQRMKIALLGLGTVGKGIVSLLAQNGEKIELKTGLRLELAKVLVRNTAPRSGYDHLPLTTNIQEILDDPSIQIVVEVMGGVEPARSYMVEALKRGKTVVTANKDVFAAHDDELYDAGRAGDAEIYFEASVGGGIPVLRPLKESLAANTMQKVMGIVNGTTNYILTQMSEGGRPYEEALREAQDLGFAEPDPTNDVQGYDAARKLAILASLAFDTRIKPHQVFTEGITKITPTDIAMGKRFGWTLKLLAIGKEVEGRVEARVHPAFVPNEHPLASVAGSLNAIFTVGQPVGETMFYGRGAGAGPTASAVIGDLIAAALSKRTPGRRAGDDPTAIYEKPVLPIGEVTTRFYLRLALADEVGSLAAVASAFATEGVSIAQMIQGRITTQEIENVVVTHGVQESAMQAVMARLRADTAHVRAINNLIRVEA
jgi:homoserine dehydrogenase